MNRVKLMRNISQIYILTNKIIYINKLCNLKKCLNINIYILQETKITADKSKQTNNLRIKDKKKSNFNHIAKRRFKDF